MHETPVGLYVMMSIIGWGTLSCATVGILWESYIKDRIEGGARYAACTLVVVFLPVVLVCATVVGTWLLFTRVIPAGIRAIPSAGLAFVALWRTFFPSKNTIPRAKVVR